MATQSEIDSLRRVTALEPGDPVYTDQLLGQLYDDLGYEGAAALIWREKAAQASSLVDMSESGSSRSLSQLRKGYLEMADAIGPKDTISGGGSFTVPVERV